MKSKKTHCPQKGRVRSARGSTLVQPGPRPLPYGEAGAGFRSLKESVNGRPAGTGYCRSHRGLGSPVLLQRGNPAHPVAGEAFSRWLLSLNGPSMAVMSLVKALQYELNSYYQRPAAKVKRHSHPVKPGPDIPSPARAQAEPGVRRRFAVAHTVRCRSWCGRHASFPAHARPALRWHGGYPP